MVRILARWIAEAILFVAALAELYLIAGLLPGDSINLPVVGTLATMLLVAVAAGVTAGPLYLAGRRDRA